MTRRWHEEIGWRADGQSIFLKTRASGRARQNCLRNFFLCYLGKEFLLKIFFMIPFISFLPPKNVTVRAHFDDVA